MWHRDETLKEFSEHFFKTERADLRDLLQSTAIRLCDATFQKASTHWFTDHGPVHSDHVFFYATRLALRAEVEQLGLSDFEAMTLAAACYIHDIGMANFSNRWDLSHGWTDKLIDDIRKWHVEAVSTLLKLPPYREQLERLYDWEPRLEEVLPIVCRAHGTDSHESACEELSNLDIPRFKGDLLGKILLLADELDMAHHRSAVGRHPQAAAFPPLAQAHQYKHRYVADVDVDLPVVHIHFGFPDGLAYETRRHFREWVCGKLRRQANWLVERQPAIYKHIFEIRPQVTEASQPVTQQICPDIALREVAKQAKLYIATPNSYKRCRRPWMINPRAALGPTLGISYPHADRLVDHFFRDLENLGEKNLVKQAYVEMAENLRVAGELEHRINEFVGLFNSGAPSVIPPGRPFVITGPTGAGKSTLLSLMRDNDALSGHGAGLLVFVDCLNIHSFAQLLWTLLQTLEEQCRKRPEVWSVVKDAFPTDACKLDIDQVIFECRRTMKLFHESTLEGHLPKPLPVVVVLDNLDRAPGFDLKLPVVRFCMREAESIGFPFFVIPLRNSTKKQVDRESDDLAAIPTNEIVAPNAHDILSWRVKTVFSKEVAESKSNPWQTRVGTKLRLGQIELEFEDFRRTLEMVVQTLAFTGGDDSHGHAPFISSMAGTNMREALTLFRAIIKAADAEHLLKLSKREAAGEHYLIKCAALERFPYYYGKNSKVRNIFETDDFEGHFLMASI
ncbi:MAG: hypothetical protein ABR964_11375 [Tepidisphaeraceae bacterium]|jgi:hypothetical protein